MTKSESSQSIDEAAADWVARRDRAALTQEEEAAFQDWLKGDARRPGALLRAQAVFLRSEAAGALGDRYDPADFQIEGKVDVAAPQVSRRRLLMAGGGLAAVMVVGGLGFGLLMPQAYATERGERRLVRLEDGSSIFLNTDTRVSVRYDGGARVVDLVKGEAFFTVAPDAKRPFTVEAGEDRISTGGASFRVRLLEGRPASILVDEGQVSAAAAAGHNVLLHAGTRLDMVLKGPGRPRPISISAEEIIRDLAWRDGKIAFQGETLAQAAAAFARYGDPSIKIRDEALRQEQVTGLFAANDPVGFSKAIASLFGAHLVRQGSSIILSRPVA